MSSQFNLLSNWPCKLVAASCLHAITIGYHTGYIPTPGAQNAIFGFGLVCGVASSSTLDMDI